jgi:hypothetical protein
LAHGRASTGDLRLSTLNGWFLSKPAEDWFMFPLLTLVPHQPDEKALNGNVYIFLYLLLFLVAYLIGFRVDIPYQYFQLLDPVQLNHSLWQAIFYLHSQPPLLNLVLGIWLWLENVSGIASENIVLVSHLFTGLVIVYALTRLADSLIKSRPFVHSFLFLFLLNPIFYGSLFQYFYTIHELFLLSVLFLLVIRFITFPDPKLFALACCVVTIMVYTRSLFHFLWALIFLLLLLYFGRKRINTPRRLTFISLAFFVLTFLILMAWPLKNYLQFGIFTYSSWQGYNLAQGHPLNIPPVASLFEENAEISSGHHFEIPAKYRDVPVLTEPLKSNGRGNWNYYPIIIYSQMVQGEVLAHLRNEPQLIVRKAVNNYRDNFVLYSGRNPYDGKLDLRMTKNVAMQRWVRTYETLLFHYFADNGREQRITGFFVFFPVVISLSAFKLWYIWYQRPVEAGTVTLILFCVLWVTVMVLFIDGAEGNRMRFSTEPFTFLLAFWLLAGIRWKASDQK